MLNDKEQEVLQAIKKALGTFATVNSVKQDGQRIVVDISSPNGIERVAKRLDDVAGQIAQKVDCAIDVNLSSSWPVD